MSTDFISKAAEYGAQMRDNPRDANEIMQVGANRIAMDYSVSYADAKATIRAMYDGDLRGFQSQVQ